MVDYVAPENEREEQIGKIWRRFLGFDQVGVHDNFIELGGTSLLATEVCTELRKAFRVDLPLKSFLTAGTIRVLAEEIQRLETERDLAAEQELLAAIENMQTEEVLELLKD
ncbi:hypothetical protein CAI21_12615 [Alkalilimnicola ehrlichii]|uniref:Carrier domain-containing protein n=1 Tax=Alkalilimnicola ehrlichii TaxID=351052 RepID=A0A3E0WZK7_9GAMM|nr:phosphopantetheine-binding protein [Alkalilimnicola ehrlichii]RFA28406.1 hypothetical protein CAI21_12615 [Alkalilimnicola ehrlichii]RFA38529.1 hypothetical protein CAL65_04045 [Alkalilimnicola ehrlichii]